MGLTLRVLAVLATVMLAGAVAPPSSFSVATSAPPAILQSGVGWSITVDLTKISPGKEVKCVLAWEETPPVKYGDFVTPDWQDGGKGYVQEVGSSDASPGGSVTIAGKTPAQQNWIGSRTNERRVRIVHADV